MKKPNKALVVCYSIIAISALILCWRENIHYIGDGLVGGFTNFWKDTFVNHASRSITIDIWIFGMAAFIFMWRECKRLGIANKWFWVYFFASQAIAISVAFPIFLIHREYQLKNADT